MHAWDRYASSCALPAPDPAPAAAIMRRRITLAARPESTKTARDFTAAALQGWHLDPVIPDAVAVASELVANAICHGTPVAIDSSLDAGVGLAWYQARRLICVVTDHSHQPPVLAPISPCAESGRGLQVVHALAAAWGWTMLSAQEKAVWAALHIPSGYDGSIWI